MAKGKLDAVGWDDYTPDKSQWSEAELLEEQTQNELAHYGFVSPGTQAQIESLTEQDYVPGYRRPRDYSWRSDLPSAEDDEIWEDYDF